jgi:hypothetical protein
VSATLDVGTVGAAHPGSLALLQQLRSFKARLRERFPSLPDPAIDTWPLQEHDALALYDFLNALPRQSVAVEIGTFTGLSSFCLALHPKVSRVVSIDPNPLLHEEINAHAEIVGKTVDPGPIAGLRVLDVARQVLDDFPEAARKIELVEGVLGPGAEQIDLAKHLGHDDDVVALVDGLHTAEGVRTDLEAVFDARPSAVAILDDCRHAWGPYVQAGVAELLGQRGTYRFTLLADVSPSFAQTDLGVVYSQADAEMLEEAFRTLREWYAAFDPLAMVAREEELKEIVVETRRNLERASARAEEYERVLEKMRRSLSWRLTKPLRGVLRAFR